MKALPGVKWATVKQKLKVVVVVFTFRLSLYCQTGRGFTVAVTVVCKHMYHVSC